MSGVEDSRALEFLDFWLSAGPSKWFSGGEKFDRACERFEPLWDEGARGTLDGWMSTAAGTLALLILLDQIPRNIFRGQAKQFSTDAKSLDVADRALDAGYDKTQLMPTRNFFYLPYMHSESLDHQLKCCDLLRGVDKGGEEYRFALIHMDAIARFGRFPHRNKVLQRESTDAERDYLRTGGFGA